MISDKEFDAIQNTAKTEVIPVNGVEYTTRPVHDPRAPEPELKALAVATLEGLVEYIAAHKPDDVVAHVIGHDRVELVSRPFGRFQQRHKLAVATCEWPKGLVFNQYLDSETFVVLLQSLFVDSEDRAAVLSIAGNLRDEQVQTVGDDGLTQQVTVRRGIARVGDAPVPNPVLLAPFRTFREIQQPASRFVLRLRPQNGSTPHLALFEADGGAWKIAAIERIKAWLAEHLPETVPVIG